MLRLAVQVLVSSGDVVTDEDIAGLLARTARRSGCSRGAAAAMALRPGFAPLAVAANGPLPTDPPCDHRDPLVRCRNAVHAEMFVLTSLALRGLRTAGVTVASTTAPCYRCAQLMVAAGVGEVLYVDEFREPEGLEILRRAGVPVRKIGESHA